MTLDTHLNIGLYNRKIVIEPRCYYCMHLIKGLLLIPFHIEEIMFFYCPGAKLMQIIG